MDVLDVARKFDLDQFSNTELEEMGLEPDSLEEEISEAVRASSRCCSDPLCPCPKF